MNNNNNDDEEFIEGFDFSEFEDIYCEVEALALFSKIQLDERSSNNSLSILESNNIDKLTSETKSKDKDDLMYNMNPLLFKESSEGNGDEEDKIYNTVERTEEIKLILRVFFYMVEYHKQLINKNEAELLFPLFKVIVKFFNGIPPTITILQVLTEISNDNAFINFYLQLYTLYLETIEALVIIEVSKSENKQINF